MNIFLIQEREDIMKCFNYVIMIFLFMLIIPLSTGVAGERKYHFRDSEGRETIVTVITGERKVTPKVQHDLPKESSVEGSGMGRTITKTEAEVGSPQSQWQIPTFRHERASRSQRGSTPPNPSIPSGAINQRTGEVYPPVAGGVIDPKTGTFHQDVGAGYVNSKTGEFYPKIGGK